ncbi:MAG: group II intron reverse transcriptase/maturase [Acholeplasmatales bacterium]|nr:group II intron reverse transcriptase/maturase [Acholeplasmatales bacterium]MBR4271151.1 group II intron reverse transcriptase/maturase [Clostridia bacterium]
MSEDIITKILDRENLNLAFKNVKANKGASGIDDMSIEETAQFIKEHKNQIVWQLYNRKYQPQPVRRVEIPKPNGGVRKLGIPTVLDRVIQQAMVQVLSPMFEPYFSEYSYGFRPNRCCQMAIIKALEYFNDGYDWVVDIDLEKFFDNVPHDRLLRMVSDVVKDGNVISLVNKFLKAGVMIQGNYEDTEIGTPQGGPLSPLLSNIMLNKLDKELEARGLHFTRYADDTIILVKSEKAANRVMESITHFIEKKLGLKVNMTKTKICKPNDLKYLGFGFYKGKEWSSIPHIDSKMKFQRKLKSLTKRSESISLDTRFEKLNWLIRGWVNYFRISKMKTFLAKIDEYLRTRIRMIIWKMWKLPKTRENNLVKCGYSRGEARGLANCRRGYMFVAHSKILQNAITKLALSKPNKKKGRRGLVFALDYYLA